MQVSLKSASLPKVLKEANVMPIFKKEFKKLQEVSLTPVLGKLMESIIKMRITRHICQDGCHRKMETMREKTLFSAIEWETQGYICSISQNRHALGKYAYELIAQSYLLLARLSSKLLFD